ncbi:MAG: hypothetical protein K9L30_02145 [Desulfobacterales bacterium]|nr:hypothetical protein [Desulfobacterales bacterium]
MVRENLDPELVKRIELVEDPTYEGESLNSKDYWGLIIVGLIIPFLLMLWGWTL